MANELTPKRTKEIDYNPLACEAASRMVHQQGYSSAAAIIELIERAGGEPQLQNVNFAQMLIGLINSASSSVPRLAKGTITVHKRAGTQIYSGTVTIAVAISDEQENRLLIDATAFPALNQSLTAINAAPAWITWGRFSNDHRDWAQPKPFDLTLHATEVERRARAGQGGFKWWYAAIIVGVVVVVLVLVLLVRSSGG